MDETTTVTKTTRDFDEVRRRLETWLAGRLGHARDVRLTSFDVPSSNGMSSETVLFDAAWDDGGPQHRSLVARLAPEPTAVPVFPVYDLPRQFEAMRVVREVSDVPVPEVLWCESDEAPIGSPFFVMERVDGKVPPDVMPYNFDSWVSAATPEERSLLQESSIDVLAQLHAIDDAERRFAFLALDRPGDTPMRRHLAEQWAYYEWAREGLRVPLIERTFAWLDEHWPVEEGPLGLSWGDSRIGNMLYRDFRPVAVLDWEMAALGPPEIDVTWFVYLHCFFEDLAAKFEVAGLPDFLQRDDVATSYERRTGYTPRDLDFYFVYAALRYAIVSVRTGKRSVHFGDAEMPDDLDDLIMHRPALEAMLAGTYWS